MRPLIVGTRGSALAMCQTRSVQAKLQAIAPDRRFQVQTIQAQADRDPELSLAHLGGEGVFVKELEAALMCREIDLAVHSLKDLPLEIPNDLCLAAVLDRDQACDAWVSRTGELFAAVPAGANVGTSSLRRQSQLLNRRHDLRISEIRGNVDTRLRKLDDGRYDAIVVAACGLIRLRLQNRITEYLDTELMVPEPGQGALAVEARAEDAEVLELLSRLDHATTRACVESERAFLRALGGGCRVPIAAYARDDEGTLALMGRVVAADGSAKVDGLLRGSMTDPLALGSRLAAQLESQGASRLLARS